MTKQSNFSNVEKTALVLLGMGNEAASEVLETGLVSLCNHDCIQQRERKI